MAAPTHDIIVVGASAGGVEALINLVSGLPADLPAAVFVVLHIPAHMPSHLPAILDRHGPLPAAHAENGAAIARGRIYVAPPDHHLLLRHGYVELSRGPRENSARPAVDPLFRTAARAYGRRVVGVVLSGALGDGAMGLLAIRTRGGVTVVQEPAEALIESMPRTAMSYLQPDHVLQVRRIAELLAHIAGEPIDEQDADTVGKPIAEKGDEAVSEPVGNKRETQAGQPVTEEERASALAMRDIMAQAHGERANETTVFTCPECGGTLWQLNENGLVQFHCHVGHTYSPELLLGQMSEDVEAALWRCVRLLLEKATLTRQFAERMRASGRDEYALRVEDKAELDDRHGQLIRDLLLEGAPPRTEETLSLVQASNAEPPIRSRAKDDRDRSTA